MTRWLLLSSFALFVGPLFAAEPARPVTQEEVEFFEKSVRPILADNCFSCHGPKKQMSGLRLDSAEALHKGGDKGLVVIPGKAEQSALILAIRHSGDLKMPPKKKLAAADIDALTAWVNKGAPWPSSSARGQSDDAWQKHWAFQPVRDGAVPGVKDASWARSPIDLFVLARLADKGIKPSALADRRTLIRRATFDLHGLPPTPEETAGFLADTSPDAFARVVDRLLASPRYGERWGRHWLDVARYADTKGYVFFQESEFPWAYTYRDYVIRSFNNDLPYDRFIVEQLAADRLPLGSDKGPLTALGFLTLGGRFMNNEQDILDDRIDVVTRGLLGLTVTCARCHDHKFDPIPSTDYYSLYGVFASCTEPAVPPLFAEPPKTEAYTKFETELAAREYRLDGFLRDKRHELARSAMKRVAEYWLAAHSLNEQPNTEDFMLIADGNDLNPRMLIRWQAYLQRTRKTHHPVMAPWHALCALPSEDFASRMPSLLAEWSKADVGRPLNPLVVKALTHKPLRSLAEAAQRYNELLNDIEKRWQRMLLHAVFDGRPIVPLADPAQEELRQVFHGPDSAPNLAHNPMNDLDLLPDRPSQGKLQELRKAVETWRATGAGAPPRAMVLEDLPAANEQRVFLRGNPNLLGDPVPRQFLQVLTRGPRQPFTNGSGRLELAQAIASRSNPLTARVLVNRVWAQHFGSGLIKTRSDFGLRSDPPSHPELLDYLAADLMKNGWSIKRLHRAIMRSSVYQQKSNDRPECKAVDPENNLLWRANRHRLDFETMRDTLLAVAGRLDQRIGGPSARDILTPASTRRTLYGFLDRLNVPGLYRTFDFPSPDATSPERSVTTVAPQALFMMNNPFVVEMTRHLLRRPEIARAQEPAARVQAIYEQVYGRGATSEEVDLARSFIAHSGEEKKAWENYAQALLLTNELAFVD
jgi:hypothetical protein